MKNAILSLLLLPSLVVAKNLRADNDNSLFLEPCSLLLIERERGALVDLAAGELLFHTERKSILEAYEPAIQEALSARENSVWEKLKSERDDRLRAEANVSVSARGHLVRYRLSRRGVMEISRADDIHHSELAVRVQLPEEVDSVEAVDPNAAFAILKTPDQSRLVLVSLASGQVLLERHARDRSQPFVLKMQFSPDGRTLTVNSGGQLEVFSLQRGQAIPVRTDSMVTSTLNIPFDLGGVYYQAGLQKYLAFYFRHDPLLLQKDAKGRFKIEEFATAKSNWSELGKNLRSDYEKALHEIVAPGYQADGLVSADGTALFAARVQGIEKTLLSLVDQFDLSTKRYLRSIEVPGAVQTMALSDDGSLLAVLSAPDSQVRVFNLRQVDWRHPMIVVESPKADRLGFDGQNRLLIGSSLWGEVRRFNVHGSPN